MNKHRYRLIFNRSRGLMMAVAEHVSAHNTAPGTCAGHADPITTQWLANISPLRLSLMFMLGAAVIIATPVHADIIADPAAPASQQPVISNTANGLPLVNIQTPSAAGVSRNTYSQFDVNSQGAILNNSNANVQTQLGGWVQGNPYLANGTARVILNEVNSSNPSLLNGFIEIAGSRAQLVIANPAGISCNGCGFINANRATLTTGTPMMNSGNLMGYRVGGGSISFLGHGMDASHADYTDVITRAVEVNAGIWANNLNVMTGTNQVNVDSAGQKTSITPITTATTATTHPSFAVDVASLGGMYAGKIHLIGTEAGLGVRNAGAIGASVGEVTITHDGHITNRGSISAQTTLQIQATGAVDNTQGTLAAKDSLALQSASLDNTGGTITSQQAANINTGSLINTNGSLRAEGSLTIDSTSLTGDGDLLSQANMRINTHGDINNTGRMIANGDLQLTTNGQLTNSSQLEAGQALDITAQSLDNQANSTISAGHTSLTLTDTLTNRGLIDGSNTFIQANTIHNIGTARLYGDHVALQANNLVNRAETITGTTTAATIAARDQLDLGINTLTNQQGATLFSAGDLRIGASVDANHNATGQSTSILNESASIEALGDLSLAASQLTNKRSTLLTERIQTANYSSYHEECVNAKCSYVNHITTYTTEYEDQVTSSSPAASILAGGNGIFAFDTLLNQYSDIEIGQDLSLTGTSLTNQGAELFHQTNRIISKNLIHWGDRDHGTTVTSDSTSTLIDTIPSIISAGGTLTGTFTDRIDNTTIREQTAPMNNPSTSTPVATAPISIAPTLTSSLFHPAPSITSHYLIETDPTFANYRQWLSSDYMVQQLAFDPAITQKRLGDGFYEQHLVREQIAQLTGKRFLEGYANDEAQYQALMSAGLTQVNDLQLIPGVALSPAQIAQLTSDIVWLVEQEVTLPDGTITKALVPQVYVRLNKDDIAPSGAVLAGNSVNLNVDHGDINTSGTIAGRNIVNISADNINNVRGLITGTHVAITANDNINIEGGSVIAKDSLIAQAGNNLTVQSSTTALDVRMAGTANRVQSQVIDRVAGLYVSNPDAVLVASAGNDLNLMAAAIQNTGAGGQTLLQAGNNLNISTVQTTTDSYAAGRKSWRKEQSTTEIGSNIATNGDITLKAGNDLEVKASGISSQAGNLNATAGGDLTITAGTNTLTSEAYRKVKTTSRKKEYRDTLNETTSTDSTLSAENITLQAGTAGTGNLAIEGSNVVATNGTTLQATGDITIASVDNIRDETHTKKEKKSGFSGGGSSIGYGTSKLSQKQTGTTVTQTGSTVGSVESDVNIQAGHTYTQTASDVLTPKGDIDIAAQQVNITAGNNTSTQTTETKYKQSGLTLAITSPVISAIQTASQMKDAASNTSDGRMQALAAGTTALAASNAYDSTMQALTAAPSNGITDAANQVGGVNLSISIGTSKSSSTSTQTSSTAPGSSIIAGGDISIKATGAGEQSDINIIGSTIKAGGDANLKADDEVNLIAAKNTDTLASKNKGSSASVGVSIGSDGLLFTVGASGSKGKANGMDVTWTESMVQAGNKVNLESGTDTNIIGSQIRGDQVIANVGTAGTGNLNIQSLQDTSTYKDKQQSIGGSVSVGYGRWNASANFSDSKTKSDYASVNEQAGILARDGGFQVNVHGNTDLKGAVISSSEQAIADNQNSLTTETLTVSDIKNKAEYKASSMSLGGGYGNVGKNQQGEAAAGGDRVPGTTLPSLGNVSATAPVAMKASGKDDSTTVSGISQGAITIKDADQQQALTGNDAATTIALLNRDVHVDEQGNAVDSQGNSTANTLTPIFDEQKRKEINAAFEIVRAFSNESSTFLANRAKESTTAQKILEAELKKPKEERNQAVIEQATKVLQSNQMWEMGGSGRIALTAITGAFSGNVTGGAGELVQHAAIITLQSMGAQQVKTAADALGGESSVGHTALHAILACGGAAAAGDDCGTAALAASAGVVVNKLLDSIEGKQAADLTPAEKEARAKLINTLITGTTAALGGDAATAQLAAQVETENNGLKELLFPPDLPKITFSGRNNNQQLTEKQASIDKEKDRIILIQPGERALYAAGTGGDPVPGYTVIFAHASATSIQGVDMGNPETFNGFVNMIRNSGVWEEGKPILIDACNAGNLSSGIASALAKALNTTVVAPTTQTWNIPSWSTSGITGAFNPTEPRGNTPNIQSPGEWRTFDPNGKVISTSKYPPNSPLKP